VTTGYGFWSHIICEGQSVNGVIKIVPYVDIKLAVCPSDANSKGYSGWEKIGGMEYYLFDSDWYADNEQKRTEKVGPLLPLINGNQVYQVNRARHPSTTSIYGDTWKIGSQQSYPFWYASHNSGGEGCWSRRHGGRGNLLMFDGRVASMNKGEARQLSSMIKASCNAFGALETVQ